MVVRHFWYDKLTLLPSTVYEISKRLAKLNYKVTIISNKEMNYAGCVKLDDNIILKYVDNIIRSASEEDAQILHFYGSLLGAYHFLNGINSKSKLILSLYTAKVHTKDTLTLKATDYIYDKRLISYLNPIITNMIPNFIIRNKLSECDNLIVPSSRFKKFYSTIINKKKVLQILHGVNFVRYSNYDANRVQILKSKLGYKKEDKIILYLGHSYLNRGIDDLIEVASKVSQKVKHVKLLLVLNKMPNSPINLILNLVKNYESKLKTKVIVKYVQNPEEFYWLSDIVVLPYRFGLELPEYPFVLLEAMAAGKPIVTTHIGAIPEIIKNEHNGLLVPPKNKMQLTDAIIRILSDQDLARKIGKNAQNSVRSFDWDIVTKKILKIYNGI